MDGFVEFIVSEDGRLIALIEVVSLRCPRGHRRQLMRYFQVSDGRNSLIMKKFDGEVLCIWVGSEYLRETQAV